jgi:speckle-type POZ protein
MKNSSVFEAMFKYNTKESIESKVCIKDSEPEVIKEFLRFIYFEKVENLDQISVELLIFANKYEVNELKTICENYISDNLSVDNFCNLLLLALIHNSFKLIEKIIDFILKNSKFISDTNSHKSIICKHLEIISDLFIMFKKKPYIVSKVFVVLGIFSGNVKMKI